jgi:hypothetical protein
MAMPRPGAPARLDDGQLLIQVLAHSASSAAEGGVAVAGLGPGSSGSSRHVHLAPVPSVIPALASQWNSVYRQDR